MSKSIILGGGCFWCIEAVYLDLKGVEQAISGYAGGHKEDPTYEEVCRETTGHAEVVKVIYDTGVISLRDILRIFFTVHNPTTKNRQGNDIGTQYRSIILYEDKEQKQVVEEIMKEIEEEDIWDNDLVTELEELDTFYVAEEYHQNYYEKNPNAGYCRAVIAPKVAKFRKKFYDKLREDVKEAV